ncbi:MAG: thiol reductant ABC exporter subunit CydD [Cohaesibacter sp.]|jgi:ATP-binding cassette subfamily C protein CydD|nr:thiol reductant ABC exporter subunit CydD [Cohaesibacter sp.]
MTVLEKNESQADAETSTHSSASGGTEKTDLSHKSDSPKKKGRAKRAKKPADLWLTALLAPYAAQLKRKAWIEAASGVLSIAQAGFLAFAIGTLITDDGGFWGTLPYAIGLLLVIVVRAALAYLAGKLGHEVSSAMRFDLRKRLATKLAGHSPLDIERRSAGEIAALGSDVVESLDPYASRYLSLKLQLIVIPLAILIAVSLFSWAAALVLLLCGPLIPVFMAIVGIRAKKASDKQISALSDMSSRFLDRLQGMTTLRLFGAVGHTRRLFEDIATDYRKATMRVLRIAFLSSAALELFSALGIALIAIYVGYHYLGYAEFGSYGIPITLSSGLFMLMLAPEFFMPLREFAAAYHDRATAQSAAERFMQLLPTDELQEAPLTSELEDTGEAKAITRQAPDQDADVPITPISSIAFENCAFGYPGDDRQAILTDVSLSFKAGEKIAILGVSGSGKSTLLAALCGLLPPLQGSLYINDTPAPSDLEEWAKMRRTIGWIGQKPHIFHGSLLMNARLATPEADRDSVQKALQVAHAEKFVDQLPRNLLTVLGETGFGISGGQIRRLAIARAALTQSSLILCDEPTADLDAETARLVTDSLMDMAKDRLLVIATHDKEVAERCDHIFYVHDGGVREIASSDLASLQEILAADDMALRGTAKPVAKIAEPNTGETADKEATS